jgi:hypothetical protein
MEHIHHMRDYLPDISGESHEEPKVRYPNSRQISQKIKEELPTFDVVEVLERYKQTTVPMKGQTMEFKLPSTSKPLQFSRPFVDEEEEGNIVIFGADILALCDWSLPITFNIVQRKVNLFFK